MESLFTPHILFFGVLPHYYTHLGPQKIRGENSATYFRGKIASSPCIFA